MKGKTEVCCITIDKATEYILAGSVRGDVYLAKVKENETLEFLKKWDGITEKCIISLAFVNYYLGFIVVDIG